MAVTNMINISRVIRALSSKEEISELSDSERLNTLIEKSPWKKVPDVGY